MNKKGFERFYIAMIKDHLQSTCNHLDHINKKSFEITLPSTVKNENCIWECFMIRKNDEEKSS